jgi:hypothetical protein
MDVSDPVAVETDAFLGSRWSSAELGNTQDSSRLTVALVGGVWKTSATGEASPSDLVVVMVDDLVKEVWAGDSGLFWKAGGV